MNGESQQAKQSRLSKTSDYLYNDIPRLSRQIVQVLNSITRLQLNLRIAQERYAILRLLHIIRNALCNSRNYINSHINCREHILKYMYVPITVHYIHTHLAIPQDQESCLSSQFLEQTAHGKCGLCKESKWGMCSSNKQYNAQCIGVTTSK